MEKAEFSQLKEISLNTIQEVHALFPHWKKSSVQKKLKATTGKRDRRYVAISEGKVIAHVRVVFGKGLHKHRCEITSLVVAPHFRRHHVGTELMNFVLKDLKGKRELVLLAVDSKNKPAIELYKHLGFEEYGLLKKAALVSGKFVDNYLMRKEI